MRRLKFLAVLLPALLASCAPPRSAREGAGDSVDALPVGEYVTEEGWGRMTLADAPGGARIFSLTAFVGEDACSLEGSVLGDEVRMVESGVECRVLLTAAAGSIQVRAMTRGTCRQWCGYNATFEGEYRRVTDGCVAERRGEARRSFNQASSESRHADAIGALSPILARCVTYLDWEEEASLRHDLARSQHLAKRDADCRNTLQPYVEAAGKTDEEMLDGMAPSMASRYLDVITAARDQLHLCGWQARP